LANKAKEPIDLLREPFDEDQITKGTNGSSVKPVFYIEKLVDSGESYSISQTIPVLLTHDGAAAVAVVTKVVFGEQEFMGVGASAADSSDESRDLANTIKSAASDSLKRALLNGGVNTEEYKKDFNAEDEDDDPKPKRKPARTSKAKTRDDDDGDNDNKEDREEKPKRGRTSGKSRSSKSEEWDGSEDVGFGTHSDETWGEVDGSFLAFIMDKFDEGSANYNKAEAEIERRGDDYDPKEGSKKPAPKKSSRSSGSKSRTTRQF
jgi:hypothetical protein